MKTFNEWLKENIDDTYSDKGHGTIYKLIGGRLYAAPMNKDGSPPDPDDFSEVYPTDFITQQEIDNIIQSIKNKKPGPSWRDRPPLL